MSPEQIAEKTQKLRAEYPAMFSHPGLKEGEVQISSIACDAARLQVHLYHNHGLPSARLGEACPEKVEGCPREVNFHPIFVNLEEYLALEEKSEQEKAAQQPTAQPK